jgi:hypothetical protein
LWADALYVEKEILLERNMVTAVMPENMVEARNVDSSFITDIMALSLTMN